MDADSDLLFYEGLHGAYVDGEVDVGAPRRPAGRASCRSSTSSGSRSCTATAHHRGYSQDAVVDTILRRMPDYVNHICPQFSRTHVNFQRVPTVDTSNPFIARDIPTADESMVVIRFANPKGIDFPVPAVDAAQLMDEPPEQHRASRAARWDSRCSSSSRR